MSITKKILIFITLTTCLIISISCYLTINAENKLRDMEFNRITGRNMGAYEQFNVQKNQFFEINDLLATACGYLDCSQINLNDGNHISIEDTMSDLADTNMYFLNSNFGITNIIKECEYSVNLSDYNEIIDYFRSNNFSDINDIISTTNDQFVVSLNVIENSSDNYKYLLSLRPLNTDVYKPSGDFANKISVNKLSNIDTKHCAHFFMAQKNIYVDMSKDVVSSSLEIDTQGNGGNICITLTEPLEVTGIVKKNLFSLNLVNIILIIIGKVAIYMGIKHYILKRIIVLSNTLNSVTDDKSLNARVPVAGNDEITTLGVDINNMLERVEGSSSDLKYMSEHDALTGLYNRRKIEEMGIGYVNDGVHFSLAFIDLDGFKNVNDTYGHDVGDKLICGIADRLKEYVSQNTSCGRLGGDEFIIIAQGIDSTERIINIVNSIIFDFKGHINIRGNDHDIRASVGISVYPDKANSVADVLKKADLAMYHAKENGGNQYCIFNDEIEK